MSAYLRSLGETEDLRRLAERWLADFRSRTQERGTAVRTQHWIASAGDLARSAWSYELFTVEDTIEVDGQKAHRAPRRHRGQGCRGDPDRGPGLLRPQAGGAPAGTPGGASRWKADPNEVRLLGKWLVALGMAVLVLISLEMGKIPLTVFAFLGGAIAIGLGFGKQNLLRP